MGEKSSETRSILKGGGGQSADPLRNPGWWGEERVFMKVMATFSVVD